MAEWQRTHNCGEVRESNLSQTIVLNGWVLVSRIFPDQVFIDLRDRYGLTQVVFESDNAELFATAKKLGRETCVAVRGTIRRRLPNKERSDIPTGMVELKAEQLEILNTCPTEYLKFSVTEFPDEELANEETRLQYRYLDLRRRSLQAILIQRHRVCKVIRDYLDSRQFLEVETPLLGKSTPEGARDYLVPSRVFNGEFYALPQSPQLYKQLLMISGFDRYFQIARCLRDEDLRADRQPEFTQLDVEMSFVEQDDVLSLIEGLAADIFRNCLNVEIPLPLPRLRYSDAMAKYGSDKPDLRFGLEIVDVTEIAAESEFGVFKSAVGAGGVVRAINVKGSAGKYSNTALKPGGELVKVVETFKAKGLAWMKFEGDKFTGSIEKFFPDALKAKLKEKLQVQANDLLLFVADQAPIVCDALGGLRTYLGSALGLYKNWWDEKKQHDEAEDAKVKEAAKRNTKYTPQAYVLRPDQFQLAWVVDFPMFSWDEEEKRWAANHHPFTAPRDEDVPFLDSDPGKVLAKAYDLVLNGYEVGGGSIRIHRQDVQSRVFTLLGMNREDAQSRFGFLLDALQSGAPPHGGIALGLDRWCMILAGTTNIRDVIAFPKNQRARDLMTGAPATVDARQLKDLGIRI